MLTFNMCNIHPVIKLKEKYFGSFFNLIVVIFKKFYHNTFLLNCSNLNKWILNLSKHDLSNDRLHIF